MTMQRHGSSLSRIYRHVQHTGFGIITSWRQDLDKNANRRRLKILKNRVRAAGYGYVELDGYWADDDATEAGHEPSLFIPAVAKREQNRLVARGVLPEATIDTFEQWMLILARQYNQDAIVLGDGDQVYLVFKNGERMSLGKFNADKIAQAWSRIKKGPHRGRPFIFARTLAPKSHMEALRRQAQGEIWTEQALADWVLAPNRTHNLI